MDNLVSKLNKIQANLNAPKDAWNGFGKYSYRSAESILKSVKPFLAEHGLIITMSDRMELQGNRVYVVAEVSITDGKDKISVTANAREPEDKKGMDVSQMTGAASSYARKYALCGLFAIDDNKDADSGYQDDNYHEPKPKPDKPLDVDGAIKAMKGAADIGTLDKYHQNAIKRATEEQAKLINDTYEQHKLDLIAQQEAA